MTMMDHALAHHRRGFRVIPCAKGTKDAVLKDWPNKAFSTEAEIREHWRAHPDHNVAILASECRGAPTMVVDLDVKNGKDGLSELARLESEYGALPETLTAESASGGLHQFYLVPRATSSRTDSLASGVDIKSDRGYVVAAGSIVNGKQYRWLNDKKPARLDGSNWAFKLAGAAAARERSEVREQPATVDPDRAHQRAVEYLKTAPLSVKGQGGDATAYRVACGVRDCGLTEPQALDLMLSTRWHNGCGWSPERLAEKVAHAYRYAKEPAGVQAPEAVFSAEPAAEADAGTHPFDKLNNEFFYTLHGGQSVIGWETTDEDELPTLEFLSVEAFHRKHAALTFQDGKRAMPLTEAWMGSPRRRSYDKVVFKPGKSVPTRFYNMWRGFAVEPKPGDWSLMRAHIRDVISSGDAKVDRYVMGWLARMVQQPGEPGEVALVLRGDEGVGKGTLAWAIRQLFGHHARHLTQSKHLTGSFNSHLRAAAFVFADEAFWSGDKQGRGALFALITEDKLMIEAKGRDAVAQDNCIHLMMASNHDWVVPASANARRFCVLDVADTKRQDGKYFDALREQMRHGGFDAMLHDLLHYDLSAFDVRQVPQTKALAEQKTASLEGPARWLHDRLYDAAIGASAWGDEPLAVSKTLAYQTYTNSTKDTREFRPVDPRIFWKEVKRLLQSADGTMLRDSRPRVGEDRERQKVFPPLPKARSAFEANLKATIDWGEIDIFG
ncbi:bifunctional DNA primase/polymerase [Burkholderia sp. AU31624]|uniref:bifunctional DNA primase/polymerase n=1 Tax=Burkholderia sp. AU31624 TaxID=2879629 RepID=UPI001CF5E4B9|nr:bifunctional DNA primase/polymerase [Burkholderia sp. AU31624]MCA8254820.1 bifunctional DNA primase/polymerase [Burkholderia sp. AU31624]